MCKSIHPEFRFITSLSYIQIGIAIISLLNAVNSYTLRKKMVNWGSIYEAKGSLLNSKEPFMLKKSSIMTRKNPFGTKVLYRLLFIHILHYSATCCSCN